MPNEPFSLQRNDIFPATPQTPQEENASVPSQIDHLKLRVYLYKFTPEIIFGGSKPQAQINILKTAAVQELSKYSRDLKTEFAAIKKILEELLANSSFSSNDTLEDALRKRVSSALSVLIAKASVPSKGYVVVQDVKKSPNVLKARTSGDLKIDPAADPTTFTPAPGNVTHPEIIPYEGGGYPATFSAGSVRFDGSTFIPARAHQDTLLDATRTLQSRLDTFVFPNWVEDRKRVTGILDFLTHAILYIDNEIASNAENDAKLRAQETIINQTTKQYKVNRFVYDLNSKDLSRYDISKFVARYDVNQHLGDINSVGSINGHVGLFNEIIPFSHLSEKIDAPESTRRPIFFPDPKRLGDYAGYKDGVYDVNEKVVFPTKDPITKEEISSISAAALMRNMAMAQTLEDNGGDVTSKAYEQDVARIELAMRLRGISDLQKKEALLDFFRTGNESPALTKILNKNSHGRFMPQDITATGRPVGIETSSAGVVFENSVGNVVKQLAQIKAVTDNSSDGILLSDLVQKYDFLTVYVYKQPLSPDVIEDALETMDPYFFDKESLLMYTPAKFLTNSAFDSRNFATYSPEFNGFVAAATHSTNPGVANLLHVDLMGSMGLLGATRRIYNSTIFQASVFDASEIMDSRALTLFQNLFADKDPLQILTVLLDSTYLLRTSIPKNPSTLNLDSLKNSGRANEIANEVDSNGPFESAVTREKILTKKLDAELSRLKKKVASSDNYFRKGEGQDRSVASFLDILGLRAFNQFNERDAKGVQKGPRHLFNMSAFLYSNVMRSRRFHTRVPTEESVAELTTKPPFGLSKDETTVTGAFNPYDTNLIIDTYLKETDGSGGSILEINPKLDVGGGDASFKAYFLYLTDSLGQWVPQLKTGFEIMNEVLGVCYLELFETPGGRFIFRTPQYNNNNPIYKNQLQDGQVGIEPEGSILIVDGSLGTVSVDETGAEADSQSNMLTSEDITVISAAYSQKVQDLISKQGMSYGADLIGQPIAQLEYFYTNGKMVSQYGLKMGSTILNPNVRFVPKDKLLKKGVTDIESYMEGVFHYCRFFLEYSNITNFFGEVTAVGDPRISVGRTYFDVENQKFGYITSVTKNLEVGGAYTISFTLVAVRDAIYGEVVAGSGETVARPAFRRIPLMEDFIPKFSKSRGGNAAVKVTSSRQPSKKAPVAISATLNLWPSNRNPHSPKIDTMYNAIYGKRATTPPTQPSAAYPTTDLP